jgi:hypothetical protein
VVPHGILAVLLIVTVCLSFNVIPTDATTDVKWNTFKEKNGLFTIKYPSNWTPVKVQDSPAPINFFFSYSGHDESFAELGIYVEESIFSNATEVVDSNYVYLQNEPNYKVLEETECGKYRIKNISACHVQITFKDTDAVGKPMIKNLIIGAIDEDGKEYSLDYYVTKDLYDIFLPVVKEMINSLNFTGVIPSSPNEQSSSDGLPDLPPLT